jgi:hypothetical protein
MRLYVGCALMVGLLGDVISTAAVMAPEPHRSSCSPGLLRVGPATGRQALLCVLDVNPSSARGMRTCCPQAAGDDDCC